MATELFFEPYPTTVNANQAIFLPQLFLKWLEVTDGDKLEMQCAKGKHGVFIYIRNPKQQKKRG